MNKIDFKQPRYIFPLVAFLPIVFLVYNISGVFGGEEKPQAGVVTDSINTALPEADARQLEDKLTSMDKVGLGDDNYTGIGALGQEEIEEESVSQGYSESELDQIDKINAQREQEAREREELNRALAESRRHINSYQGGSSSSVGGSTSSYSGNSSRSQYDEMEAYAQALEEIQTRNRRLNGRSADDYLYPFEQPSSATSEQPKEQPKKKEEPKPEIVYKAKANGADHFHTLSRTTTTDAALIKAIIDKTTKAREGTRLRFKLLDDVTIKGTPLKKGTYLYGVVNGFSGQRVTASITSILINDKFVKVNLSVYDNDGMEGFYVPASVFRSFVKDAGAQAVNSNININSNSGSELSGETLALQALQNVYSSASNAVSNNIRQDKARIKYNTTVYLINASQTEE